MAYLTPTLVQQTTNSGTSVSSVAITFSAAINPNNTVVVGVGLPTTASVSSISSGTGTWVNANVQNGVNIRSEQWYCLDFTDSGTTVVTVNFSGSTTAAVHGAEWVGIGDFDRSVVGGGTGGGTTPSIAGTLNNHAINITYCAWVPTTASASAPTNGWTLGTQTNASTTVRLVPGWHAVQTSSDSSGVTASTTVTDTAFVTATYCPAHFVKKFYLHAALAQTPGTLPAAGGTGGGGTAPTVIASGGDTNRVMDNSIGASQTSIAGTTNAVTTAQSMLIGRWCSLPLAGSFFFADTSNELYRFRAGASESNANSTFNVSCVVYVWRPSTGARVGTAIHNLSVSTATTTAEADYNQTLNSGITAVTTAQDGDILVVEAWRASASQAMATAYTNTVFYDGTTEGSASTNAAYLLLTQGVALQDRAAAPVKPNPYLQIVPQ